VFIGPEPGKALRDFFESNGWEPVTGLEATFRDLAKVVEQGEGSSGDNPDSHHAKFQEILSQFRRMKDAEPSFEPARPVLDNPFARTPPEQVGPVNLFDNEDAIRLSDLFNEAYGAMLQLLARFFVLTDEAEDEASALCDTAIEVMFGAIAPLGELLTRLPAGPSYPGLNAGPSFVVRTVHPLPYKSSAWRLLRERFQELEEYTNSLVAQGGVYEPLKRVSQTFSRAVSSLSSSSS